MSGIQIYDTKLVSWEMFEKIVHLPYTFTRVDVPPTNQQPEVEHAGLYWTHQFYNFTPIDDPEWFHNVGVPGSDDPIYLDILNYLEQVCPKMPPRANLYAAYINVLREGNDPGIHVDAPYFCPDNKTVLVYMNPAWDPQWGGETIFYNDDLDAVRLVQPRPGRVVIFDGRIPHTGRPPTPKYKHNRYILSYKYMDPATRQKLFTDHEMNGMPPVHDRGIAGFNPETVKEIWESYRTNK
tara:strand:- start:1151 stop:1864 length:714 start_codon:yes stop_codon:yes gene_type:complete